MHDDTPTESGRRYRIQAPAGLKATSERREAGGFGTDNVDLDQIQRWEYQTPIAETMEALHDLVRGDKNLSIGASAMFAWSPRKRSRSPRSMGGPASSR
jgi:hypothetical protein